MVFHNSFDLNEFLAYLLPGSLLLIAAHYFFGPALAAIFASQIAPLTTSAGVLGLVSYFAAALAAGHLASVWTRVIMRPLSRLINRNARMLPLGASESKFYGPGVKAAIQERFSSTFKMKLEDPAVSAAAPRLIRSYVLQNSQTTTAARDQIVRARSLCGNLTLPLLVFALILIQQRNYILAALTAVTVVALVYKQADLDIREWKEIYTGFLALGRHT